MGNRILKISNVKKTIHYLQKNGLRHAFYAAKERIEEEKKTDYVYIEPDEERLAAQRAEQERFSYRFSIVVPAYETKERYLRELFASVIGQSYENWELVIADAGSSGRVKAITAE
ncbi:MAG: glycosyltransferase, partial [Lachnospiraceae bacterium]|nr:glycosyltransferase [Lachnospiraceae bacterium]